MTQLSFLYNLVLICAMAGLAYGLYAAQRIFQASPGNPKMQEIAGAIQEGARGKP